MFLKRWEPLTELRRFDSNMDRMRRQTFRPFHTWPHYWHENGRLDIDVYQDADSLVVRATLPGVKPEDAEVTVADGTLSIKGEAKFEKEIKEEQYLHREHRYGAFHRTVVLPRELNTEKAEATYDNGILTVTIPRSEASKHKPLKINVKAPEESKS